MEINLFIKYIFIFIASTRLTIALRIHLHSEI